MAHVNDERLSALLGRYYAGLLRLAWKLCGDGGIDPQDLVQETAERALLNGAHLASQTDAAVRAWLCRTLLNLFRDRYRRRRTEHAGNALLRLVGEEAAQVPDAGSGGWKRLSEEAFRDAVRHLPPEMRRVFLLRMSGLRDREIAQQLRIPMGTVASRLFNARSLLRKRLQHWIERDQEVEAYIRGFRLWS